jgi:hypothetical protein
MLDWIGPDRLYIILDILALVSGIVLTHALFLYSQFYRESQGYMWRAARKLWAFVLLLFLIEAVVGGFFFYLTRHLPSYISIPSQLWAAIIGIIVAAIPTTLENILLPKDDTTVQTLQRRLTRLLLKLNILLRYNFAWNIEYCREQDVFDCQHNGWGLNIPPRIVGRRIRMLYEFIKYRIAEERGDPTLLVYDVDRIPWTQFYILVRHVGRKKLREYIKNPVMYFDNWDGRERRRKVGTRKDRDESTSAPSRQGRRYDDPKLVERIKSRRPSGSIPIPLPTSEPSNEG